MIDVLPCDDDAHGGTPVPEPHHDYGRWGPWRVAANPGWEYRERTCTRCDQVSEESRRRAKLPQAARKFEAELAERAAANEATGG